MGKKDYVQWELAAKVAQSMIKCVKDDPTFMHDIAIGLFTLSVARTLDLEQSIRSI